MTSVEDLERQRRSMAMLAPGTLALAREEAMGLLAKLIELCRWADDKPDQPRPLEIRPGPERARPTA
jgi:hypothetical protein